ncbi:MAG: aldo/keto reductase family protein [Anaerolineae bacterium]|nr:aldo/keto reductase family protein [Anaerolineae bacterium]
MQYRRLGNAGIKVSEVSLGAWLTFGEKMDEKATAECVGAAIDRGINFFDLADAYARGEAERVFGKVIKAYRRSDLVISSKLYWPMSDDVNDRGLSRKHIMESIEGTLRRLGTDYVDIYFCHRFDPETPLEETLRAMDDLVHQGKVLYWGTSTWTAAQIEQAVGIANTLNLYRPQVEQPRYNMLDRHIEAEIMSVCASHGIGLTVYSPLAQGILTGKYNDGIPEGSRAAEREWLRQSIEENIDKVRQLTAVAQDLGISMSQLALAWILRRPEISSVITGASRPEHVVSNAAASGVTLDEDVLAQIEEILGNAPQ